jgi:hypothetical protein
VLSIITLLEQLSCALSSPPHDGSPSSSSDASEEDLCRALDTAIGSLRALGSFQVMSKGRCAELRRSKGLTTTRKRFSYCSDRCLALASSATLLRRRHNNPALLRVGGCTIFFASLIQLGGEDDLRECTLTYYQLLQQYISTYTLAACTSVCLHSPFEYRAFCRATVSLTERLNSAQLDSSHYFYIPGRTSYHYLEDFACVLQVPTPSFDTRVRVDLLSTVPSSHTHAHALFPILSSTTFPPRSFYLSYTTSTSDDSHSHPRPRPAV